MDEFHSKFLKKMLRTRKAEAVNWLRAKSSDSYRNLGEMKHRPSVALVRRIYDTGAVEVLAVDIQEWDKGETSSDLIVQLPSDSVKRFQIFDIQRQIAEKQGYDGTLDEGQDYLYFKLC